jgi:CheY-like chemotaxis protein
MNLSVNARDAMPSGGILTLETANVVLTGEYCRARNDVRPGAYVMLAVTDTGLGMDDTTKSRAFEPFFTTKPIGTGTGLGLATVYGIVQQSGGAVDIESALGDGTSIRVYLPAASALEVETAAQTPPAPSAGGQETLLVVEDEEPLRRLIARVLKGRGYDVLVAGDSAEALNIVAGRTDAIDLLITDVVLPGGMRGDELAAVLTASCADLPVLFISGYAYDATGLSDLPEGEAEYLGKPFTPDALVSAVSHILDRGSGEVEDLTS